MSSFTRCIERQRAGTEFSAYLKDGKIAYQSALPREIFYQGRGSKLGVTNPKGKELLARLAREAKKQENKS